MTNIINHDENKHGELIELTVSPWNPQHFAIKNATRNEFTVWSDIEEYEDAYKKFRYLVEK